jgi:hypothetical protein
MQKPTYRDPEGINTWVYLSDLQENRITVFHKSTNIVQLIADRLKACGEITDASVHHALRDAMTAMSKARKAWLS